MIYVCSNCGFTCIVSVSYKREPYESPYECPLGKKGWMDDKSRSVWKKIQSINEMKELIREVPD